MAVLWGYTSLEGSTTVLEGLSSPGRGPIPHNTLGMAHSACAHNGTFPGVDGRLATWAHCVCKGKEAKLTKRLDLHPVPFTSEL